MPKSRPHTLVRKVLFGLLVLALALPGMNHPARAAASIPPEPYLIADLNQDGSSSYISQITRYNDRMYFSATNGTKRLLWYSTGTDDGAQVAVDVCPATTCPGVSSTPMAIFNGLLYFVAHDGTHGWELWKTDGTQVGSSMVKDIYVGAVSSTPENLTVAKNRLYFTASAAAYGRELWSTDGTPANTALVKDIHAGTSSSNPSQITVFPNTDLVFFSAYESATGYEFYRSYGSDAGTYRLLDINPGPASSFPKDLVVVGAWVYFRANDGTHGEELWKSADSDVSTVMVKDIYAGAGSSSPQNFFISGSSFYFQARTQAEGAELWVSDGTLANTNLVMDIAPGAASSSPANFVRGSGRFFFTAADLEHGRELWQNSGGVVSLVMDVVPGPASSDPLNLKFYNVLMGADYLVFSAYDPQHGRELWSCAFFLPQCSLKRETEINPGLGWSQPENPFWFNDALYFRANDGVHGSEFFSWIPGGEPVLVRDINTAPSQAGAAPYEMFAVGSEIYFNARVYSDGSELWKSDGTAAGTQFITHILPDTWLEASKAVLNGSVYFVGEEATYGRELYRVDPSTNTPQLVKDIVPGSDGTQLDMLIPAGSRLFFRVNYKQLWSTDGTEAGTIMLKDFSLVGSESLGAFIAVQDRIFFAATTDAAGRELWVSDGTIAGTTSVADIYPGNESSRPSNMAAFDDRVCFEAYTLQFGHELWCSNGTAAGTFMVKDINPGMSGSSPDYGQAFDGKLYFTAYNDESGRELWVSDGTPGGTMLLIESAPGPDSTSYNDIKVYANGKVFFVMEDSQGDLVLWMTDGTPAGTERATPDQAPFTMLNELVAAGPAVFMVVDDEANNPHFLMVYQPTPGGAYTSVEIGTGMSASAPFAAGSRLFFSYNNGTTGEELWAIDLVQQRQLFLPLVVTSP